MINLNKLSTENLEKIQKFLEIALNHIELFGGYNRLSGNKIPLEKFKKENIDYYEALAIISGLGDEIAEQLNEHYKKDLSCFNNNNMLFKECADLSRMRFEKKEDYLRLYDISEEELKSYLIIRIKDLKKLKEAKEKIDKKLKEFKKEKKQSIKPVELFTNEVVPSYTSRELQRQMEKAQEWKIERWEREKLHKEQMKQDRILRTPVDKYTHALDLIIERAEFAEDDNSFSIEFYDFNFEEMIGSRMLEKFLDELQNNDCFEKYIRTNYDGGTRFGFTKVNIKNLKKFQEKRGKVKEEKIVKKDFKENEKIKKITIIKMNNSKYLFAINDNYKEAKKILGKSEWWQIFIKEIRNRNIPPERRTDVKEIPKEMADYFNYNAGKCPIYFKGKYKLTNVFIGQGVDTMISSDIKTETISEKKYLGRKQKQINSKK